MEKFQFLIGRLSTLKKADKEMEQFAFQFLIGRLSTSDNLACQLGQLIRFNSLQVDYQLLNKLQKAMQVKVVSIPYRQTINSVLV